MYEPVTPNLVDLDAGEEHLNTFPIQIWERQRSGGFLIKFTAWQAVHVTFQAHLTSKRLLLEPPTDRGSRRAESAGLLAVSMLVGGPVGAAASGSARNERAIADAILDHLDGSVLEISLDDIVSVERFQHLGGKLIRINLPGGSPDDYLAFGLPNTAVFSSQKRDECADKIQQAVNSI
jgi:hypothetical protein